MYVQQRLIDAPVDPVGKAHPETARAMGRRMELRMGTMRRMAYDAIVIADGLTAEEVGLMFGWKHQSYSAAVSTLKTDGWLECARGADGRKITRPTQGGNEAEVMVARRAAA